MTRWWRHRRPEGERTAEVTYNALEDGPASPTLRERTAQGVRQAMSAFRRIASTEIGVAGVGAVGIGGGAGGGFGAAFSALDWERVRGDVLQDCRVRIRIMGASGCGKSTLLTHLQGLHGAAVVDAAIGDGAEDCGLFETRGAGSDGLGWVEAEAPVDLIVWMIDACGGVQRSDIEALGRMRSSGRPLVIVLNKIDAAEAQLDAAAAEAVLGARVVAISAVTGDGVIERLLPAIVDACPATAVALGREVPAFRGEAVRRVIRRAAALSGMSGFDFNPFADVPNSAAVQMQLVMRIAAVYGDAPNDRYSRELLAAVFAGMLLRGAATLLLRTAPLVGGVLFQGITAGATYALGRAADRYFRNGRRWRGLTRGEA
jgi:uncharacterized protein (DUF697 family)